MKTMNLWAVGRNYADHAKEMNSPTPKSPLIFLKSGACLEEGQDNLKIPSFVTNMHHEIELAVKLDQKLEPNLVALALDLTARDHQSQAKEKGHPWTMAKSFKGSCPVGTWIPFKDYAWFESLDFNLQVNGETKQQGQPKQMIFNLEFLLEHLKKHFPLQGGDIILTGTPSGVGPLKAGDQLKSQLLDQVWELEVRDA